MPLFHKPLGKGLRENALGCSKNNDPASGAGRFVLGKLGGPNLFADGDGLSDFFVDFESKLWGRLNRNRQTVPDVFCEFPAIFAAIYTHDKLGPFREGRGLVAFPNFMLERPVAD